MGKLFRVGISRKQLFFLQLVCRKILIPCTCSGGRQLHVSLSEHKVFDISALHNFCGKRRAPKSRNAATLNPTAHYLRNGSATAAIAAVDVVRLVTSPSSATASPPSASVPPPSPVRRVVGLTARNMSSRKSAQHV